MPTPGSTVGGYRLDRLIGKGGFGEVYQAASLREGKVVALKLVSLTREEEVIAAERLGALLQQRFESAHGMVPKVFEPDQDEHYFYIPMEFVDAPALSTLVLTGQLQPMVAARHAASICEFLEKAHAFATVIDGSSYDRVIHADLKPAHILMPPLGGIKVLDFGIAKALEKNRLAKTVKFGTPHYMSPERLETGRANEHDDMWALGVILYEMVSGHRPYAQIEDPYPHSALCRAIETNAPRDPLPSSCPLNLAAIVHKLLNHEIQRRYGNAGAIKEDLEAFLRGEAPQASREFATPETTRVGPVPPTVPLPDGGPATMAPTVVLHRPTLIRRSVGAVMLAGMTALFTMEAVAWLGAERMRAELGALAGGGLTAKRDEYQRLQRWSLLHLGPRLRLNGPLKDHLVSLADAVLLDYRQEEPTVAEVQWRQAAEALKWAAELAPADASIFPKELDCEAHLDRIKGQNRINAAQSALSNAQAIAKFRRSAGLDPRSPDPYLGLSRTYIYGLGDVDQGAAAIQEAVKRGHQPGWRERAQLGDGYRMRGDKSRKQAEIGRKQIRYDDQRRELESARDDYARCVEFLTPILDHGNSRANRDLCQRRLEDANRELDSNPARRP